MNVHKEERTNEVYIRSTLNQPRELMCTTTQVESVQPVREYLPRNVESEKDNQEEKIICKIARTY